MNKVKEYGKRIGRIGVAMLGICLCIDLSGCSSVRDSQQAQAQIKIGVTLYDSYDTFLTALMTSFKSDFGDNVTMEMFNASQDQQTQNAQVKQMIEDGCDVICVNLVDRTDPSQVINAARESDIPIIFFNRELVEEDLQRWDKLYYVGADAFESGIMEGEMAAKSCLSDASADMNGDGMIQYMVLEGEAGHQDAIVRTEYCVNTMLDEGVNLDKVGYAIANWNRAQAQTKIAQILEDGDVDLELILANNDDMALGAIDAYKASGLLRSQWPMIFGIDGTEDGLEAVRNDEMIGTVYNDKEGQALAMYKLAYALASGGSLDDLDLADNKYIRLPYTKVTPSNVNDFLK